MVCLTSDNIRLDTHGFSLIDPTKDGVWVGEIPEGPTKSWMRYKIRSTTELPTEEKEG